MRARPVAYLRMGAMGPTASLPNQFVCVFAILYLLRQNYENVMFFFSFIAFKLFILLEFSYCTEKIQIFYHRDDGRTILVFVFLIFSKILIFEVDDSD